MASTARSLVLGFVATLPSENFRPFADSLRATSYQGRFGLVTARYDAQALAAVRALADISMDVSEDYARPRKPIVEGLRRARSTRGLQRAYPAMFAGATRWGRERTAQSRWEAYEYALEGLQSLRYRHYRDFILQQAPDVDYVLLSDVRDVIFQGDPMDPAPQRLEVFLEDASHTIGTEPFNRRWINDLYGKERVRELAAVTVSCSGTVVGPREEILEYCRLMSEAIGWRRRPMGAHDQGVHNHLLRGGSLGDAEVKANRQGRVLTMGGLGSTPDLDTGLLNDDGSRPPVLHQYDRFPELAGILRERLASAPPAALTRVWLAPAAYAPRRGGIEELTAQLARELTSRGHQVTVVVHRWPGDAPEREQVEGIDVRRLDFAAPSRHLRAMTGFAGSIAGVQRALAELPRPDLIHVQGGASQLAHLTAFATRRRVPVVLTTQGEVVMDAGRIYQRSAYQRLSLRVAARRAAALTACSEWTRLQTVPFAAGFGHAAVIPNAVTPQDWSDVAPPTTEPVFAAWGRQVPQKGFDLLLDAFALVREANPAARLLLGGDGPERAALEKRAGPGVEFLGSLDRGGVRDLLGRARVAVVPSRVEPFGIVALEALAAGRVLVYNNVGGLPEAAGPHGFGVDAGDTGAFAAALTAALSAPAPAAGDWLGRHSWASVTDAYLEVYARVLQGAA